MIIYNAGTTEQNVFQDIHLPGQYQGQKMHSPGKQDITRNTGYIHNPDGFTLVELLVAMAIGLIVLAAVVTSFISQNTANIAQESVVETQQNARAIMDTLTRDIRSIGYNPTNKLVVGLTTTGITGGIASTLTFTRDDGDGALETVEYSLYDAYANSSPPANDGKVDDLACQTWDDGGNTAGQQPVAENINHLEFRYLDSNGDPTSDVSKVRSIQVSFMVESAKPDLKSPPPSQTYTTPAGTVWTSDSGYRSFFMTTTINCRNLGL